MPMIILLKVKDDTRCNSITNSVYSGVDEPLSELIAYRRERRVGILVQVGGIMCRSCYPNSRLLRHGFP